LEIPRTGQFFDCDFLKCLEPTFLWKIKEPHNTGKDLEGRLFWEHSGTVLSAWLMAEL
jgi:hypothetical protein